MMLVTVPENICVVVAMGDGAIGVEEPPPPPQAATVLKNGIRRVPSLIRDKAHKYRSRLGQRSSGHTPTVRPWEGRTPTRTGQ